MIERTGDWSEVEVGTVVLSPTEEPLLVTRSERGWFQLKAAGGHRYRVPPQDASGPVKILEATEEEALLLVKRELGADYLVQLEREERMVERAKRWLVPPFPRKGERDALDRARDHVQWYHGTYAGSAENGGFKTLKHIAEAHEEMHDPDAIGGIFMDKPHTHKES